MDLLCHTGHRTWMQATIHPFIQLTAETETSLVAMVMAVATVLVWFLKYVVSQSWIGKACRQGIYGWRVMRHSVIVGEEPPETLKQLSEAGHEIRTILE